VVVFGLGKDLLFKYILGHCESPKNKIKVQIEKVNKSPKRIWKK
jgi:hypothetical protein